MGWNGQFLSGGIGYDDIKNALGESHDDIISLCKSNNINQWAIFKPESHNTFDAVSLDARKDNHMGLAVKTIPELKDSGTGVTKVSLDTIRTKIWQWEYNKPKGTETSPCRISDFLDARNFASNGYNHLAHPCDDGWKDVERNGEKYTSSCVLVSDFSFRFDETSASNFGSADSNYMPLSFVVGGDASRMYMGAAVWVESQGGWMFIRGNKSFGAAEKSEEILPSLATNQWLGQLLGGEPSLIRYIPRILDNPQTISSSPSYISMSSGTIYGMPSGAKDYTIKYNYPIKNTIGKSKDGTTEGYMLSGSYYISLGGGNQTLAYMVKGYTDGVGNTYAGWFITSVPVHQAGGYYIKYPIMIYATRSGDSKAFVNSGTPPEDMSFSGNLHYRRLAHAGTSGNYYIYNTTWSTASGSKSSTTTISTYTGNVAIHGGYISGPSTYDSDRIDLTVELLKL